jgi:hypothetical protein
MSKSASRNKSEVGSVFDLPAKSFQIVKDNWQLFAVVNILTILSAVANTFNTNRNDGHAWGSDKNFNGGFLSGGEIAAVLGIGFIGVILFVLLSVFFYTMSTRLALDTTSGKKADINKLVDAAKKYWVRMLGLILLSGLLVGVGLILLIIPGLIILGRIIFAPYLMIERDLDIVDSLKASNEMTKDRQGDVWSAIGLFLLISIFCSAIENIPVAGPMIGTALAIAFSLILVLRYQEIKGSAKPAKAHKTAKA